MIKEIRLGDVVSLRKPHPCGSRRWRVERVGADIAIRCLGCQHRIMLERAVFERRLKAIVPPPAAETGPDG